jgi:hypothetical protein
MLDRIPHLIDVIRVILSGPEVGYKLPLIPCRPLCIAWVPVDSANVLPHLGLNRLQEPRIGGIEVITEGELRPGKYP